MLTQIPETCTPAYRSISMNLERLNYLFTHFESGIQFLDEFDFTVYFEFRNGLRRGCLLAECLKLWPNDFALVNNELQCTTNSIFQFFGLTQAEFFHLFTPQKQNTRLFGGKVLLESSSKAEVLDNFKIFLDLKNE